MKRVVIAFAVLALCAGQALAGGGGSKANATIKFVNKTNQIAAVAVDLPQAILNDIANNVWPTPQQWAAAGGKTLTAGKSVGIKVKAGGHEAYGALVDAQGNLVAGPFNVGVGVDKGKTLVIDVQQWGLDPK